MDYKSATRQTYNQYSELFNDKFEDYFKGAVFEEANLFIRNLPDKRVLDLGSGSGNHALFFTQQGLDVLCVDLSEEMVTLCRAKGLQAEVMDMEHLTFPAQSFDGVWAYASLFHVPKASFKNVVGQVRAILKPGGIFAFGIKEGEGEGMEENPKYPGVQRWYSYFKPEEIAKIMGQDFEQIYFYRDAKDRYTFIDYQFKLKN